MTALTAISNSIQPKLDLAGYCYGNPNYRQTRARINYLVERYLSLDILSDRLIDLSTQFENPHQRPWQSINWKAIDKSQIIGVEPELFIVIIASAAEIETPIRAYAKESWDYLQKAHPPLARFVGGIYDENGKVIEVGIWEKEERQHAPVFSKIYQQLTKEKLNPIPNTVKGYQPTGNIKTEIYQHALGRITTEWSAVAMYIWLMAHSTGALQMAIAQPLQDEVNHLAKFWGIARWSFGNSAWNNAIATTSKLFNLSQHHKAERTDGKDFFQKTHLGHSLAISFTFIRVMSQMWRWNYHLQSDALIQLFGMRNHSEQ